MAEDARTMAEVLAVIWWEARVCAVDVELVLAPKDIHPQSGMGSQECSVSIRCGYWILIAAMR